MRLLIVLLIVGLLVVAPTVEADGTATSTDSPTTTSSSEADDGPDPTGCRPYCFST